MTRKQAQALINEWLRINKGKSYDFIKVIDYLLKVSPSVGEDVDL